MHSACLLEFFRNARLGGELDSADARVTVENAVCGDQLVLAGRLVADRLVAVRFLARGCVASMGCAAALSEALQGRTLAEVRAFSRAALVAMVDGLPETSGHAATLALMARDALLAALPGGHS